MSFIRGWLLFMIVGALAIAPSIANAERHSKEISILRASGLRDALKQPDLAVRREALKMCQTLTQRSDLPDEALAVLSEAKPAIAEYFVELKSSSLIPACEVYAKLDPEHSDECFEQVVLRMLKHDFEIFKRAAERLLLTPGHLSNEQIKALGEYMVANPTRLAESDDLQSLVGSLRSEVIRPYVSKLLRKTDITSQLTGLKLAEMIGADLHDLAPEVCDLLGNSSVTNEALGALTSIGFPDATHAPKLQQHLDDVHVQLNAAVALHAMGVSVSNLDALVLQRLKRRTSSTDWILITPLLGGRASEFREPLARLVLDEPTGYRLMPFIGALIVIAEQSGDFQPLAELVDQVDSTKKFIILAQLSRSAINSHALLEIYEKRLLGKDVNDRIAALKVFSFLSDSSAPFAMSIVERLSSTTEEERNETHSTLRAMGKAVHDAFPTIVKTYNQRGEIDRNEIAKTIEYLYHDNALSQNQMAQCRRLRPALHLVHQEVEEELTDVDKATIVRKLTGQEFGVEDALATVRRLGTQGAEFAPHVWRLTGSPLYEDAWEAILAIEPDYASQPEFEERWEQIIERLDYPLYHAGVFRVLKLMGPTAIEAGPRVAALIRSGKYIPELKSALMSMGPGDMPTLIALLNASVGSNDRAKILAFAYEYGGGIAFPNSASQDPAVAPCWNNSLFIQFVTEKSPNVFAFSSSLESDPAQRHRIARSALVELQTVWTKNTSGDSFVNDALAKRVVDITKTNADSVDLLGTQEASDVQALETWQTLFQPHHAWAKQHIEELVVPRLKKNAHVRIVALWAAGAVVSHGVVWLLLLTAYPWSPWVQAVFFWNPWVRRIAGFGYVGFLLSWTPPLRRILFSPFRKVLLADAALGDFDPDSFFADVPVYNPKTNTTANAADMIPHIRGRTVLVGESGSGKSMLLRWLTYKTNRLTVFLSAVNCTSEVEDAIAAKLEGVASDKSFVKTLVYAGALDVCIDGLNEANSQTIGRICSFVNKFEHGNIILTMQPINLETELNAQELQLQPLPESKVREFLHSRESSFASDVDVRGEQYQNACDELLAKWRQTDSADDSAIAHTLSNPMDLTSVAELISRGETPDANRLQEQQFQLMLQEYRRYYPTAQFPVARFAEAVYQSRVDQNPFFSDDEFRAELKCMEQFKMVRVHRRMEGDVARQKWDFRHDKTMEFFATQTFLNNKERQHRHVGDDRFRGVYLLLADLLPMPAAIALKEFWLQFEIESHAKETWKPYVQRLNRRLANDNDSNAIKLRKTA